MDYLSREGSPVSSEMWAQIDNAVITTVQKHLVCRRFLNLFGPLGPGTDYIPLNSSQKEEQLTNGFGHSTGRRFLELPQLYEDFTLYWRDIETSAQKAWPLDLSSAVSAAQKAAKREDNYILFGNKELGQEGLLTAQNSFKIKRGNWKEGEDAFKDVAHGLAHMASCSYLGHYALVMSPDVYLGLQRIIPGINIPEADRIAKLVGGHMYTTGAFGADKAVLVCAEPQYMDLVVGCDINVGYLETKDFNHIFRILETAVLRIKEPNAIVNFEV